MLKEYVSVTFTFFVPKQIPLREVIILPQMALPRQQTRNAA